MRDATCWQATRGSELGARPRRVVEPDRSSDRALGTDRGDRRRQRSRPPLTRLTDRASHVTLIDIDRRARRHARRRLSPVLRRTVSIVEHDVTAGAADAIIRATVRGQVPDPVLVPEAPLPGAPYDLVIGDLLYSQLLYPAMIDLGISDPLRRAVLDRYGPVLVRGMVARLHASAPYGRVAHLHDPLGCWPGHPQPVALPEIVDTAQRDVGQALRLIARGCGPRDADPARRCTTSPSPSGRPLYGAGRSPRTPTTSSARQSPEPRCCNQRMNFRARLAQWPSATARCAPGGGDLGETE